MNSQYLKSHKPLNSDKSPLPKIWLTVRAALDKDSRNYITKEQYYQLCENNNLTDRKDMLRLRIETKFLIMLIVGFHFITPNLRFSNIANFG